MKNKKIMIIRKKIPDFSRVDSKTTGGIGSYYGSLEKYYSDDVIIFDFYSNLHKQKKHVAFALLVYSYFRVFSCFLKKDPGTYVLNLSLDKIGLLREGLVLYGANLFGKKTIVFFHGWKNSMVDSLNKSLFMFLVFKFFYKRADVFIVLAKDFKEQLVEWGFNQNIYIETTAVDDSLLKDNSSSLIPEENEDSLIILYLARIEKYKGIFETIAVFERLAEKYPFLRLVVSGDGNELESVKSIVREKGINNVDFTGYVSGEEKKKVFERSDIYLFPSYGEGMPISVLEAMSFGLPIVTRSVGGLKDFFEQGKMGYMTDSKDPDVFADSIEKIILSPKLRNEMSTYNKNFAKQFFMASSVAKRLERIYKNTGEKAFGKLSWRDGF